MLSSPVQCKYCGAPTKLYIREVPVCVPCANDLEAGRDPGHRDAPQDHAEILRVLKAELAAARVRVNQEAHDFNTVMRDIPSGLPHPDELQRILNASAQLTSARQALGDAEDRVNEFLVRGTVPEHLKKGPGVDGAARGKASGVG
jgi:hypothetical protein